jgi:hypothetical protein
MKTFGSSPSVCILIRSPRIAPPENGLDGSIQMIPTRSPRSRYKPARRSTSEDFPAPGAPVMPTTRPRPVCGNTDFINAAAFPTLSSTFEIARATARVSPARMRSSSVLVVALLIKKQ